MFDIAWSELLVILVVALVVVGPKDLPRLMRTAGQWAGRARAMADQFRRSFDDMARQSELDELRAEVQKLQQQPSPLADIESAAYDFNEPSKVLGTLNANIEEVGAAPPKFDTPEAAPPDTAPTSESTSATPSAPEPASVSSEPTPPARQP